MKIMAVVIIARQKNPKLGLRKPFDGAREKIGSMIYLNGNATVCVQRISAKLSPPFFLV